MQLRAAIGENGMTWYFRNEVLVHCRTTKNLQKALILLALQGVHRIPDIVRTLPEFGEEDTSALVNEFLEKVSMALTTCRCRMVALRDHSKSKGETLQL